jgi:hypothetical protein
VVAAGEKTASELQAGQLWVIVGVCVLLGLVYPEQAPSNTAFTEVVDFAGIFVGLVLG